MSVKAKDPEQEVPEFNDPNEVINRYQAMRNECQQLQIKIMKKNL